MHMLDALEVQAPALAGMQAHHFWRKGDSVLDVGAGSGEMTLYLQAKYGLLCRGVDIVKPNNNMFFAKKVSNGRGREFLPIDLFDGVSLPCADKSYDLVMINSVLHHAANKTHGLVREAARVARKYIVVLEDLNVLGHRHRSISRRNYVHDRHGVFRTLDEWMQLFRATPGIRGIRHDMLCQHMHPTRFPCFSFEVSHALFYVLFVIEV